MAKTKFKTWEELEEGFNFTDEEEREIEFEVEMIRATIEARKKAKLTQQQLSELTRNKATFYCED